jgi:Ubiquitin-like domain
MTYFKGKCGEGHVERHDYRIATEDGKSLVQSNNWGSVVQKGKVLVMSMVVMKVALDDEKYAQRQRNVCPHCYVTQIGVMPDEGWLKWCAYSLFKFASFDITDSSRRCERRFGSAESIIPESQPPDEEENIAVFRNLHLVLVRQVCKYECFQHRPVLYSFNDLCRQYVKLSLRHRSHLTTPSHCICAPPEST